MDELELRRSLYSDPYTQDPEILAQLTQDKHYAMLLRDIQQLDQRLQQAVDVPVPANLAANILFAQTFQQPKFSWKRLLAPLFSVFLGMGTYLYTPLVSTMPLKEAVLAHTYHALIPSTHANLAKLSEMAYVKQLIQQLGGQFEGRLDLPIIRAEICQLSQHDIVHLVLEGQQGAVTILIMPQINAIQDSVIYDQRLQGVIIPSSLGSFAVIGEQKENLQPLTEQLLQYLTWHS